MKGQWIGQYESTNNGTIIVDIDDDGDRYLGYVRLETAQLPGLGAFVRFRTPDNKSTSYDLKLEVSRMDLFTGKVLTNEDLATRYPGLKFPTRIDVRMRPDKDSLTLDWVGDNLVAGAADIPRSKAKQPSTLRPERMSWSKFKEYVADLPSRKFIFRGQEQPWRLQSKYHRMGRANLDLFLLNDIQALHRNLSARTKHIFNLTIPDENGAFMHLIQHHGYPTPLLDWSYSPFVAAYFAFRHGGSRPKSRKKHYCRIFVLDQRAWRDDFVQINSIVSFGLHFSIMEFIAIENERMIPQQALSTVTNIDDIESYVLEKQASAKKVYLRAIDIPAEERPLVMKDLQMMGVTAGSLFPGLDGACEELQSRFFPN